MPAGQRRHLHRWCLPQRFSQADRCHLIGTEERSRSRQSCCQSCLWLIKRWRKEHVFIWEYTFGLLPRFPVEVDWLAHPKRFWSTSSFFLYYPLLQNVLIFLAAPPPLNHGSATAALIVFYRRNEWTGEAAHQYLKTTFSICRTGFYSISSRETCRWT